MEKKEKNDDWNTQWNEKKSCSILKDCHQRHISGFWRQLWMIWNTIFQVFIFGENLVDQIISIIIVTIRTTFCNRLTYWNFLFVLCLNKVWYWSRFNWLNVKTWSVCVQRCGLLPHETRPFSFLYILDQGDWAFFNINFLFRLRVS